jgi:hypothetical protein
LTKHNDSEYYGYDEEIEKARRRIGLQEPLIVLGILIVAAAIFFLSPDPRRLQYDAAISKWRSQNITEYDAQVSYDHSQSLQTSIRVRDGKVVKDDTAPELATKSGFEDDRTAALLNEMSVEGMFAQIDYMTTHNPFGLDRSCSFDFDAELGYPLRIECKYVRRTSTTRTYTRINSLKVLQRAAPSPAP